MSRTIASQLQHAVLQSKAFGHSKHDDRALKESRYKTYSNKSMKSRIDSAKDLGKYIQSHYPECRMARDITPEMINKWLEGKAASGCTQGSLDTYSAESRFIERACERAYPTFKGFDTRQIKTPREHPDAVRGSNRGPEGMTRADFNKLKESVKPTSNTWKALTIQEATGARSEGVCNLKGSDITINGDKCTVHLKEKGGRERNVDVIRKDQIDALRALKSQSKDGYIVNHRGDKLKKPESLQKAYNRAISKLQLSKDYKGATTHSVRKLWSNERYREYRKDHTKLETVQYINEQLGHGAERDEALLAHYVADLF